MKDLKAQLKEAAATIKEQRRAAQAQIKEQAQKAALVRKALTAFDEPAAARGKSKRGRPRGRPRGS